jgi:hypothetical protein
MVGMVHEWFLKAMESGWLCREGQMWGAVHGQGLTVDGVCARRIRAQHGPRVGNEGGMMGKLLLALLVGSEGFLLVATNVRERGASMDGKVVMMWLGLGLGMMRMLRVGPVEGGFCGLVHVYFVGHLGIGRDFMVVEFLEEGAAGRGVEGKRVSVGPQGGIGGVGIREDALVGVVSKDVSEGIDVETVLRKGMHFVCRDGVAGRGSPGGRRVGIRGVGVELEGVHSGWTQDWQRLGNGSAR